MSPLSFLMLVIYIFSHSLTNLTRSLSILLIFSKNQLDQSHEYLHKLFLSENEHANEPANLFRSYYPYSHTPLSLLPFTATTLSLLSLIFLLSFTLTPL